MLGCDIVVGKVVPNVRQACSAFFRVKQPQKNARL